MHMYELRVWLSDVRRDGRASWGAVVVAVVAVAAVVWGNGIAVVVDEEVVVVPVEEYTLQANVEYMIHVAVAVVEFEVPVDHSPKDHRTLSRQHVK